MKLLRWKPAHPRRLVSSLVCLGFLASSISGITLARGMQQDRTASQAAVIRSRELGDLRTMLEQLNVQLRTLLAAEPTFVSQGAAAASAVQSLATIRTTWERVRTSTSLDVALRDQVDAWFVRDIATGAQLSETAAEQSPNFAAFLERMTTAFDTVRSDVLELTDQAVAQLDRSLADLDRRNDQQFARVATVLGALSALLLGAAICARVDERRRARFTNRNQERVHLETRVKRALGMAETEDDAVAVLLRAASERAGGTVSAMMADSSRAHFQRWGSGAPTCSADGPASCPAARGGRTLLFESSEEIDSCRHLKPGGGSPCGAVCVPMAVDGATIGVLHHTRRSGEFPKELVADLDLVAGGTAQRIGMLRALRTSQTQAATDPLTGLPNRRHVEERLRLLRLTATPYSVAYLDLDHFKELNDRHGHETGDRALRLFARVCLETVRSEDMVSRFGGEEFVLVLPRADTVTARDILERLRANLLAACDASAFPPFTVSAGLAEAGPDEPNDQLIARADGALLIAKRTGRDRVVVAGDNPDELARYDAPGAPDDGVGSREQGTVADLTVATDDGMLVGQPVARR